MDYKFIDSSKMKTLEDYMVCLAIGIVSLKTLEEIQIKALNMGSLKEDHECRANTIIWDIRRLIKLYLDQASSIGELVSPDFSAENILQKLKGSEVNNAKLIIKATKNKSAQS